MRKVEEDGIMKKDKEDCEERKKRSNIELFSMYHVVITFITTKDVRLTTWIYIEINKKFQLFGFPIIEKYLMEQYRSRLEVSVNL